MLGQLPVFAPPGRSELGSLISSGGVKREHYPEMGTLIINVCFPFFLYKERFREVDILCVDVLI